MTAAERDRLRRLQDRWLVAFAARIAGHPDDTPVTAHGPTIRQVREDVLPGWAAWFREQLAEKEEP